MMNLYSRIYICIYVTKKANLLKHRRLCISIHRVLCWQRRRRLGESFVLRNGILVRYAYIYIIHTSMTLILCIIKVYLHVILFAFRV